MIIGFIILTLQSFTQVVVDTSLTMDSIIVVDYHNAYTLPNFKQNINASKSHMTVDALGDNPHSFIKNYGPGSIATLSIRGSSSSQTTTLWNGIPITHPMIGITDISLIPGVLFNKVTIIPGAGSTPHGNGTIGGFLSINNLPKNDPQFNLNFNIGSFHRISQYLEFAFKKSNLLSSTKLFVERSSNNFRYKPFTGSPYKIQEHGKYQQFHILESIEYTVNSNNQLSLHFWANSSARNIPPLTTQTASKSNQKDSFLRAILSWKHSKNTLSQETKIAFLTDYILYTDSDQKISSSSQSYNYTSSWKLQYKVSQTHTIGIGLNVQLIKGETSFYNKSSFENRASTFIYHKWRLNEFEILSGLRISNRKNNLSPISPNFQIKHHFNNSTVYFRINRNFRFPALNDLYWTQGGNLNLEPEKGWNQEVGYFVFNKINNANFIFKVVFYHRLINDWILWSPQNTFPLWSAYNLDKVRSYGLNSSLSIKHHIGRTHFQSRISYDHSKSIHEKDITIPTFNKGEQIIYTPIHQFYTTIDINYENWNLSINHRYTSSTIGVNENLKDFWIGDVSIKKKLKHDVIRSSIAFTIKNLWNADYKIIERRPMPGRNYLLSFNLELP